MAVGMYFTPEGFDPATYDEAISRLQAAGAGSPPGRTYHAALVEDGKIRVFDVWDSMEQFEEFGKTLVPILGDLGANPGTPMVLPVHNVIT